MGPAEFLTGQGIDVRPHPHIGLATVTYLMRGRIHHRDSLGTDQWIEPGAVNWMVAGQGITHSERTDGDVRAKPHTLFGLQTWVALPKDREDDPAAFVHAAADGAAGAGGRGQAGAADPWHRLGRSARRCEVLSETFYADALLEAGAALPLPDDHEDRGVYVLAGEVIGRRAELRGGADAGVPARATGFRSRRGTRGRG